MSTEQDNKAELLRQIAAHPRLAHAVLFKHRHPQETPEFHGEMIDAWHSPLASMRRVLTMVFRGGAKSTTAEEAITAGAAMRQFRHALIVAESERLAISRLGAIKNELESNTAIERLFGAMPGPIWQATQLVLSNGGVISALGRGQSMRGIKHLDARPDFCFLDDLEDEESVKTPANRDATMDWFMASLLPALEPGYRIRVAATPLDPDAFAMRLAKDPEWKRIIVPVEYLDPNNGARISAWPDRFPLDEIDNIARSYTRAGKADVFQREYMCRAVDPATKVFTADMFRFNPARARSWHAVYAMYDPARTVKATSAATGKAVWSWLNNRLIVWSLTAHMWMPSEIIDDMFKVDDEFHPVQIGVERDGLEEFILQPLRQAQVERGHMLPIRPEKAPKGKLDFIKGLQPFFRANEIEFAGDALRFEEGVNEFLSYPTGRIDAPNALAYALKMRSGAPIYDDFSAHHIVEQAHPRRVQWWLALNATQQETAAVLIQVDDGALMVHADWLREGDPGVNLANILAEAGMEAQIEPYRIKVVAGPQHHSGYDTVGLLAAARRVPITVRRGGDAMQGREEARRLLRLAHKGFPMFRVAEQAVWTLRALSGGYCRKLNPDGRLADQPEDNAYAVLMGGVENFCALLRTSAVDVDSNVRYTTTSDGRKHITALATGR
jgi:hypothetical protein